MSTNPFEPPKEVNEPVGRQGNGLSAGRLLALVLIGAMVAFGLVRLWMESANWGW